MENNESTSESESEYSNGCDTDDDLYDSGEPETELKLHDISFDPIYDNLSDHDSDGQPVKPRDDDTTDEDCELEDLHPFRINLSLTDWCKCGECIIQRSNIECFCCIEVEVVVDILF